jgi:hypothetical protein
MIGWKYLKMGQCADCEHAGARLFVPVLDGEATESKHEGYSLLNGNHIPHFDPVCWRCTKHYALDNICTEHKLPKKADRLCKKCFKSGIEYRQRAHREEP